MSSRGYCRSGRRLEDCVRTMRFLLCLLLSNLICMAQAAKVNDTPKSRHPPIFDQVTGMPLDQVLLTLYDLNRDATRWKKTLSQISLAPSSNTEFLLDREVRLLLGDANDSLADIEKATASVAAAPKVADVIAIAFDLSHLHETVANISGLAVMVHDSPAAIATSSSALRLNADRWQQITKDVAREVQPYRDAWQSYTYHLGQTIDNTSWK